MSTQEAIRNLRELEAMFNEYADKGGLIGARYKRDRDSIRQVLARLEAVEDALKMTSEDRY